MNFKDPANLRRSEYPGVCENCKEVCTSYIKKKYLYHLDHIYQKLVEDTIELNETLSVFSKKVSLTIKSIQSAIDSILPQSDFCRKINEFRSRPEDFIEKNIPDTKKMVEKISSYFNVFDKLCSALVPELLNHIKGPEDNFHIISIPNILSASMSSKYLGLVSTSSHIHVYALADFGLKAVLSCKSTLISAIEFQELVLFAAHNDSEVTAWDVLTSAKLYTLVQPNSVIKCLKSTDAALIAGCMDGRILVWRLETRELITTSAIHKDLILCISVNKDHSLAFVASDDRSSSVWDLSVVQAKFFSYQFQITSAEFLHCGSLAAGDLCGIVIIFTVADFAPKKQWKAHDSGVNQISASNSGKTLITSSDTGIKIWDLDQYALISKFPNHRQLIFTSFFPSSSFLCVFKQYICTVNPQTQHITLIAAKLSAELSCVSCTDKYLSLGTSKGDLIVWDLEQNTQDSVLQFHDGPVSSICIKKDYIASCSGESEILIFHTKNKSKKILKDNKGIIIMHIA